MYGRDAVGITVSDEWVSFVSVPNCYCVSISAVWPPNRCVENFKVHVGAQLDPI